MDRYNQLINEANKKKSISQPTNQRTNQPFIHSFIHSLVYTNSGTKGPGEAAHDLTPNHCVCRTDHAGSQIPDVVCCKVTRGHQFLYVRKGGLRQGAQTLSGLKERGNT